MNKISIVTAFFDIGRANWTQDKGYPHYLARTVDTYMDCFSRLCQLENDITVIINNEHYDRIKQITKDRLFKTNIICMDLDSEYASLLQTISRIQNSEEFIRLIPQSQIKNPEYWNSYYVLVTNLKARFVNEAIKKNLPQNDMIAWIDFGYMRTSNKVPRSKIWSYNFDPNKIHLFEYKDKNPNRSFIDIVINNDVHVLGAQIVAHKKMWPLLDSLMERSWIELNNQNIVDDDQGLLLMSKHSELDMFESHKIPDHQLGQDPFVLFQKFNDTP
jgi:protein YibB